MDVSRLGLAAAPLPAAFPAWRVPVSSGQLLTACRLAWEGGGRLVALWVTDDRDRHRGFPLRVALEDADGLIVLEHTLPDADAHYPDVAAIFPAANRMQRAAFDLTGIAADSDDQRQWLWQACWPIDRYPLRRDFEASPKWEPGEEDYAFVRVEGDGVHEIPVGPVHAGIIEPGHFRFQVVGEKVLRLEERLGYVHKGIEKRFEALPLADACRLAGRVSGDSTVAYAWSCAQAIEAISGAEVPPRAAWLRALALERERIANHLRRSRLSRQRLRFRVRSRAVLAPQGGRAADEPRRIRAPVGDGLRGARRCRRRRLAGHGHRDARRVVAPRARDRRAARHLRRAQRPAGPRTQLRDRHARARGKARFAGTGGTRERSCARPAPRSTGRALRRSRRPRRLAQRWRRRGPRRRPLRRDAGIAAPGPRDRRRHARRRDPREASPNLRHFGSDWVTSKAGAARCSSRSKAGPTARSGDAIRTIPRGRRGRCSSTR